MAFLLFATLFFSPFLFFHISAFLLGFRVQPLKIPPFTPYPGFDTHLATNVDSVGEEGVCVGVVQVLRSREATNTVVAVGAVVIGALNLR